METIIFKNGKNTREKHLIFAGWDNPKTLASYLLLKNYYRSLEDPLDWETDWRYYFIVRRHWLRKQKKYGVWVCHYCGKEIHKMPERNKRKQNLHYCVTVDHKVPRSEGINILDTRNFLVSCYDCNSKKKSTPYKTFMKIMSWKREQKIKEETKKAA